MMLTSSGLNVSQGMKYLLPIQNWGESPSRNPHLTEENEQNGGGPFGKKDSTVEKTIGHQGDPEKPGDQTQ
jgi:hypothetical protein